MAVDQLIEHFAHYIPLRETEKNELRQRVVERRVKRREFILQENDPCKYYTFVVSGCFKMYGVDNEGGEHIIQFAAENEWIADISSFHSGKASRLYIEAL
jgi:CRP-like cAMP-binding protein